MEEIPEGNCPMRDQVESVLPPFSQHWLAKQIQNFPSSVQNKNLLTLPP